MDTEAIATEIVTIRNRLDAMDSDFEGTTGTDIDDERKRLEERLRLLQNRLSADGSHEPGEQDLPAEPDSAHYLPPA